MTDEQALQLLRLLAMYAAAHSGGRSGTASPVDSSLTVHELADDLAMSLDVSDEADALRQSITGGAA